MAYATSDLYKEAINKSTKTSFIDGQLKTTKGTPITIDNKSIDSGSLYITNQCVSSDAFAYGAVFAAEAGITLKTDIDRYSLYDAEITLFFNLLLSNNEYERIPLGKFYVNEPNRVGKNITIKAYDKMINLEKDIDETTTGSPYDLLTYIAEECDVELSQTEAEVKALTNGEKLLLADIGRVETFRDLLSYIALITCTFAIFDREGKLRLCEYGEEVVKTIDSKQRTSSKFSDFETYYTCAKGTFVSGDVYKAYYHKADVDDGLMYDVGEVPVVQGLDETNQETLDNLFTKLEKVRYVPCDVTFSGDPSIDLGDKIINVDRFGNSITSYVTFYKWSYRGGHQIKSAGSNPKLAEVKEKKNRDFAELEAEIQAKTVAVYPYTNAKKYSVKGGQTARDMVEVIRIAFAVNDDSTSLFMATIPCELDYDGFVEFSMYVDSVLVEDSTVCQYCHAGKNIISFMNYMSCEKGTQYKVSVLAKTYSEETPLRVNDAKTATNKNAIDAITLAYQQMAAALKTSTVIPITSLSDAINYTVVEPIKNVPTATIEKFAIKAAIFGQGLAGKVNWDGTITLEDSFENFEFVHDILMKKDFGDSVSTKLTSPTKTGFEESFSDLIFESFDLAGMSETLSGMNVLVVQYVFETAKAATYKFGDNIDTSNNEFKLKRNYVYDSMSMSIDAGAVCAIQIDESQLKDIESVNIEVVT